MLEAIRMRHISIAWVYLLGLLVIAMVLVASIAVGSVSLTPAEVFKSMLGLCANQSDCLRSELIVQQIRLPRALLALLVGALLAICGAVTQGLFRNPLADPSLIGVTSGASLGASAVIVMAGSSVTAGSVSLVGLSFVSMGAFVGGGLAVMLVYRLAQTEQGTSVTTLLLAGIGLSAIAGGFSSLFEFYADNVMLRRISLWRMGGLDGANYLRVGYAAIALLLAVIVLPRFSMALNAFLLGESEARHLGIDVDKIKRFIILLVAAGMGVSVSIAGAIGFIGLIVPHLIRMLVGPDHKHLIPLSAILGAALLMIADVIARLVVSPSELPVGVVTAFIGAPIFIAMLRRRHQYGMQAS